MWYKISAQYIELSIYAKPNAKTSALLATTEDELHIALHAKPREGEANKELIRFLAQLVKIPKTQIKLIRGETGRHKLLQISHSEKIIRFIQDLQEGRKA